MTDIPAAEIRRLSADAQKILISEEGEIPRSVLHNFLADLITTLPNVGDLTHTEKAECMIRLTDYSDPSTAITTLQASLRDLASDADQATTHAVTGINEANRQVADLTEKYRRAAAQARTAGDTLNRYRHRIMLMDSAPTGHEALDGMYLARTRSGRIIPVIRLDPADRYPWKDLEGSWYANSEIHLLGKFSDTPDTDDQYDDDEED